ncbi:MAG TPA: helix-turn-helix domain-containing protein [Mycobacterium sp.]|nr:helix-turn-helix domain-containing protein [Mycobacterium sp.]
MSTSGGTGIPRDPIFQAVDLLGDAWSWLIMRNALFDGDTRFTEFQRDLKISRKVLSTRLESLTNAGVLRRNIGRGTVGYAVTDMGLDFLPSLLMALAWGERWAIDRATADRWATHLPHGHDLQATFNCSECATPLAARDVRPPDLRSTTTAHLARSRTRTPNLELIQESQNCAIARSQQVIGDRWSALVIRECFLGTRNFNGFQENLGIATNILVNRLDRLVALGVIIKHLRPGQSSHSEYRLSERGLDLYGLPLSLLAWAQKWVDPQTPTEQLWHLVCGRETSPVLACGTCGVAVRRQDIELGSRRADVMTDLISARQTAMNAESSYPTGAHADSS